MLTVALLGTAQRSPAQATPELLTIPDARVLLCKVTPPAAGAHTVTVQLSVGRATDPVTRSIRSTFDSSGHPVNLVDAITVLDQDRGISMHTASARLSASAVTGFTVTHARSWSEPAARLKPAPKGSNHGTYVALSEDQKKSARVLAVWVWAHRCKASGLARAPDPN